MPAAEQTMSSLVRSFVQNLLSRKTSIKTGNAVYAFG